MGFVSKLASGVGGALGLTKGNSGTNFSANAANLMEPTNTNQIENARQMSLTGLTQQQALLNALAAQGGTQNQSDVYNQQQALANQLQGVINGTGPNPALQQLQNTTGQNIANQAALMAGQRGTQANAGLLARQIGQQGANLQQQAVGQGAALQAQQQLNAMNALQQQQGMMGNLAGQQIAQQANTLQGYNQAAQNEQSNLLSALGNYNQSNASMTGNQNTTNAQIQSKVAENQSNLLGGLGNAAGVVAKKFLPSVTSFLGFDQGGMVPNIQANGPKSFVGRHFMSKGGHVPGKSLVHGNSIKNDTVPAMLSPGEIVIPRSVLQSKDPISASAKFVQKILAKGGNK